MKDSFEDKVRKLIRVHQKKTGEDIREVRVFTRQRIGYNGERQIIVNYWTNENNQNV